MLNPEKGKSLNLAAHERDQVTIDVVEDLPVPHFPNKPEIRINHRHEIFHSIAFISQSVPPSKKLMKMRDIICVNTAPMTKIWLGFNNVASFGKWLGEFFFIVIICYFWQTITCSSCWNCLISRIQCHWLYSQDLIILTDDFYEWVVEF